MRERRRRTEESKRNKDITIKKKIAKRRQKVIRERNRVGMRKIRRKIRNREMKRDIKTQPQKKNDAK